jgi:LysM repeat protein
MPKPNPGTPERPTVRARGGCGYLFGGGSLLFVCALIVLAGFVFWPSQSSLTLPTVVITEPQPGDQVIVNEPVFVSARVDDPDRVAKAELWVNGQLVATQLGSAESAGHLLVSQVWRPTKAGAYTVLVRGVNSAGYIGESTALILETVEKSSEPGRDRLQIIAQPGDTVGSLAQQFGTTPGQLRSNNPDLGSGEVAPGDSILVPHPPESGPSDDAPTPGARPGDVPPGDGPAQVPQVEPPPDESLVPGESQPADPQISPLWDRLPGWREAFCNRPLGFMGGWLGCPDQPRPGVSAPNAPRKVSAKYVANCQVKVGWVDASADEAGFKVYQRLRGDDHAKGDLVFVAGGRTGSGASIFKELSVTAGRYRYYVAAFNGAGASPSAPSAEILVPNNCTAASGTQTLDFEALTMTVRDHYDRLYCYASLGGSPFERVPSTSRQFIVQQSGRWNIADYASGQNHRSLVVPGNAPLEVTAECFGWRGRELSSLGRFQRMHLPPEWDGRELTGDAGGYSVTYRIQPHLGRDRWALERPDLAVPYDLTDATPYITWRWTATPGDARPIRGFKVYRQFPSETAPGRSYHETVWPSRTAPLEIFGGDCFETAYYRVSAVLEERDLVTGEDMESAPSEVLEIRRNCPAVIEVTITGIRSGGLCDDWICGDKTVEAYGTFNINNYRVQWNYHCDAGFGGGCLYPEGVPNETSIPSRYEFGLQDKFLSAINVNGGPVEIRGWLADGKFRQWNNRVLIPMPLNQSIDFSFRLKDHDSGSGDDRWCSGSFTFPSRSLEQWRQFNEQESIHGSAGDGSCDVGVWGRYLPPAE